MPYVQAQMQQQQNGLGGNQTGYLNPLNATANFQIANTSASTQYMAGNGQWFEIPQTMTTGGTTSNISVTIHGITGNPVRFTHVTFNQPITFIPVPQTINIFENQALPDAGNITWYQQQVSQYNWAINNAVYNPQHDAHVTAYHRENARIEAEKREVERRAARDRAKLLLLSILNPVEQAEYQKDNVVHVRSKNGKLYRVKPGWSHNVQLVEDGKEKKSYCIHPNEWVPEEDNMVAQILMLRHQEEDFLKTANVSHLAA